MRRLWAATDRMRDAWEDSRFKRRTRRIALVAAATFLVAGVAALATGQPIVGTVVAAALGVATGLFATYLSGADDDSEVAGQARWALPLLLAVGCLTVVTVAAFRESPATTPPELSVGFVDIDMKPVEKEYTTYVSPADGTATMYLQVAVENLESRPLKGVRVELTYPPEVEVVSSGKPKVTNAAKQQTVYEHVIGTVEPGQPYYAMADSDTIEIPIRFKHDEFCRLDEDRMPSCVVLVWEESAGEHRLDCLATSAGLVCMSSHRGEIKPTSLEIGYRIFTDDRPTLEGVISTTSTDPGESSMESDSGPKVMKISEGDEDWYTLTDLDDFGPSKGRELESWTLRVGKNRPVVIAYRKVKVGSGFIHQELYVDGILRKTLIGRSNWVFRTLENTDDDPQPDVSKIFGRFFSLKWRKSDFKAAYTTRPGGWVYGGS